MTLSRFSQSSPYTIPFSALTSLSSPSYLSPSDPPSLLPVAQRHQEDEKSSRKPLNSRRSGGGKRKASYKHIPHRLKPPHLVAKRNARERTRVQAVNSAFFTLRKHVPFESRHKKLSKVKTLRSAIQYIKHLQEMIQNYDSHMYEETRPKDATFPYSHDRRKLAQNDHGASCLLTRTPTLTETCLSNRHTKLSRGCLITPPQDVSDNAPCSTSHIQVSYPGREPRPRSPSISSALFAAVPLTPMEEDFSFPSRQGAPSIGVQVKEPGVPWCSTTLPLPLFPHSREAPGEDGQGQILSTLTHFDEILNVASPDRLATFRGPFQMHDYETSTKQPVLQQSSQIISATPAPPTKMAACSVKPLECIDEPPCHTPAFGYVYPIGFNFKVF